MQYNFKLKCSIFFKVIGRTVPRNNHLSCLFIFISPLHVSALDGHLQVEYTIFSGSYLTHNGSVVLVIILILYMFLANTAVVYLIEIVVVWDDEVRATGCRTPK
jgi:hypothetical protein